MEVDARELRSATPLVWAGRVISALPVVMLAMSAAMKFVQPEDIVKGFDEMGYPLELAVPLGIVEVACTVLYVVPRTAVLGAILLTGYLGGATATHVRLEQQFVLPVVAGVLVWLGLYLRDARLRALVPLRN